MTLPSSHRHQVKSCFREHDRLPSRARRQVLRQGKIEVLINDGKKTIVHYDSVSNGDEPAVFIIFGCCLFLSSR